jgi:hypothetical protein
LCEGFMERSCRVALMTDKAACDSKLDSLYRSAALASKARVQKKGSV